MKKLISIITMLLVVIGISGCGSSAPTEVTVVPEGKIVMLTVGKDIAPGNYKLTTEDGENSCRGWITKEGTSIYDRYRNNLDGELYAGPGGGVLSELVVLNEDDVIFIEPKAEGEDKYYYTGTITLTKE